MDHQAEFTIPSSYSRVVARELQLQERDLPRLLAGTGLPLHILLPGDETRISGHQQVAILVNAQRLSGRPDIGLRIGRRLQPSTHGPIGYLVLSSPTLIAALEALRDFLPLRIPFARLHLEQHQGGLICELSLLLQFAPRERQLLVECFAMLIQELAENFSGRPLAGARVELDYPAPAYAALYSDYFHIPVAFGQTGNRVIIPLALALEPSATGDPASYAHAQALCRRLLDELPTSVLSMRDRVRRFLLSQPLGSVGEEEVARAMFVSKRTLARRLQQEDTGFRAIREQLLSELAASYLQDSALSVEAIAALLGYHDSANFRRACHRWFGCSPAGYRAGKGGSPRP